MTEAPIYLTIANVSVASAQPVGAAALDAADNAIAAGSEVAAFATLLQEQIAQNCCPTASDQTLASPTATADTLEEENAAPAGSDAADLSALFSFLSDGMTLAVPALAAPGSAQPAAAPSTSLPPRVAAEALLPALNDLQPEGKDEGAAARLLHEQLAPGVFRTAEDATRVSQAPMIEATTEQKAASAGSGVLPGTAFLPADIADTAPQVRQSEALAFAPIMRESGGSAPPHASAAPAQEPVADSALVAPAVPPVQPAARNAARIEALVGTHQWNVEIAERVVWMVGRNEGRVELSLNPPHMGRIEISLSVSGDQASAVFVSASQQVRDSLEQALPRLREILSQAGVQLGQTSVNAESAGRQDTGPRLPVYSAEGRQAAPALAAVPGGWARLGRGLVDTFV